jgi:hypothetical protein
MENLHIWRHESSSCGHWSALQGMIGVFKRMPYLGDGHLVINFFEESNNHLHPTRAHVSRKVVVLEESSTS